MKNTLILFSSLFLCSVVYSQVGINTSVPNGTLEIAATPNDAAVVDGVIAPKLTGAQLKAKDGIYTTAQIGAIVYVTEALTSAATTTKTVNVTQVGYYYFDGTVWEKFIDTVGKPTGFERLTNNDVIPVLYWRLIGSPNAQVGGKYSVDASWAPSDLSESLGGIPYSAIMGAGGITSANLGAKGKNSFVAGSVNSSSGDASTAFGAGNTASASGTFTAGVLNKSTNAYAVSLGYGNTASGATSVAMGNSNLASGENSAAIGQANEATAQGAFALGNTNHSTQISAVSIGQQNTASAQGAFALGNSNTASASSAVAIGQSNQASGQASIAMGNSNVVSGASGVAIGHKLLSKGNYSVAMGYQNTDPLTNANRLFVLGNGDDVTRSDAFTILKNGKVGIDIDNFETAGATPQAKLQVNGSIKVAPTATAGTCNAANEGTIEYFKSDLNNGSFRGCGVIGGVYGWVNL